MPIHIVCDFASTSYLVALPIYSFHCVRDKSSYYQVCVCRGGGRGGGEEREGGAGVEFCFGVLLGVRSA